MISSYLARKRVRFIHCLSLQFSVSGELRFCIFALSVSTQRLLQQSVISRENSSNNKRQSFLH